MARSLLGLGANLGDPAATLEAAVADLRGARGVEVLAMSEWLRTTPVGGPAPQPEFFNGAALIETSLTPQQLFDTTRGIESRRGRERRERWAARTLDIDLLLYAERSILGPTLTVPHPRMSFRPFVLAPAAQVAPDMRHPLLGSTIAELLRRLEEGADLVAITGGDPRQREGICGILASAYPGSVRRVSATDDEGSLADPVWLAVGDVRARPAPQDSAKLSIVVGAPAAREGGGPTLWLPPGLSHAEQARDATAAVECVWPGLG